jgi:hypothetical protein
MSTWVQTFTAYPGVWPEKAYARLHPEKRQKAEPEEYAAWIQRQPKNVKRIFKPCPGNPRYARIERIVKLNLSPEQPPVTYKHRCIVCIDPKSEHAGNIYNSDSKLLLYWKFFLSTLARPVHLVVKTLYHLSLIGVAKIIFEGIKKGENPKDLGQKIVRSLADIVRTPLYELVMTIVSAVALLVAPFQPTLLYDFRSFTGKLSNELFWGRAKKADMPVNLTPCMSRVVNIMDFEKNPDRQRILIDENGNDRIQYRDKTNLTLVALDNMALTNYGRD